MSEDIQIIAFGEPGVGKRPLLKLLKKILEGQGIGGTELSNQQRMIPRRAFIWGSLIWLIAVSVLLFVVFRYMS